MIPMMFGWLKFLRKSISDLKSYQKDIENMNKKKDGIKEKPRGI